MTSMTLSRNSERMSKGGERKSVSPNRKSISPDRKSTSSSRKSASPEHKSGDSNRASRPSERMSAGKDGPRETKILPKNLNMLSPPEVASLEPDPGVLTPVPIKSMVAERRTREVQIKLEEINKTLETYDVLFAQPIDEYGITKRTELRNQPDFSYEKIKTLKTLGEWFSGMSFDVKGSQIPLNETEISKSAEEFNITLAHTTQNIELLKNLNRLKVARRVGDMELLNQLKEDVKPELQAILEGGLSSRPSVIDMVKTEMDFDDLFSIVHTMGEQRKIMERRRLEMEAQCKLDAKCRDELNEMLEQKVQAETRFKNLQAIVSKNVGPGVMAEINAKLDHKRSSATVLPEESKKKREDTRERSRMSRPGKSDSNQEAEDQAKAEGDQGKRKPVKKPKK